MSKLLDLSIDEIVPFCAEAQQHTELQVRREVARRQHPRYQHRDIVHLAAPSAQGVIPRLRAGAGGGAGFRRAGRALASREDATRERQRGLARSLPAPLAIRLAGAVRGHLAFSLAVVA